MSEIRISLQEVKDTADKLRTLNEEMLEELTNMEKEMNSLEGTWISDGSEEIRSRFAMFAKRFIDEKEKIDEYARFLDLTVSSYATLESTITSNASGMQV